MNARVYHVWHKKSEGGFAGFEMVATVTLKDNDRPDVEVDLEKVFELTNHIDGDWTLNKGVVTGKTSVRSTSVGDLVYCVAKKSIWQVMPKGYKVTHKYDDLNIW